MRIVHRHRGMGCNQATCPMSADELCKEPGPPQCNYHCMGRWRAMQRRQSFSPVREQAQAINCRCASTPLHDQAESGCLNACTSQAAACCGLFQSAFKHTFRRSNAEFRNTTSICSGCAMIRVHHTHCRSSRPGTDAPSILSRECMGAGAGS